MTQTTERRPAPATTIILRPLGSPLALAFLSLAISSFGFTCVQLGWIATTSGTPVALAALILAVPLQLIASVIAFLDRDSAVGTGTGLLAGTWAVLGITTLELPPGGTSDGLGVILLAAGACMLVPAAAGAKNVLVGSVITLSAARFAITGVAELVGTTPWLRAAGWVGLALSAWVLLVALIVLMKRTEADLAQEPGIRGGV